MRCRRKNRGRLEPGCHREWDALRLPPGTTGAQLLALYGSDVAIAVHRELCPESDGCSADTLAAWIMPIPATTATYLQRLALSAEPEPELGWSRAQSILATLFRISA